MIVMEASYVSGRSGSEDTYEVDNYPGLPVVSAEWNWREFRAR